MGSMGRASLYAAIAMLAVTGDDAYACAQSRFTMPPPELVEPHAGGIRVTADGIVANWYRSSGKRGAIILLGGSEGGIGSGAAEQTDDLVAHGFAVMQLAYFGAPGLPSKLDMVPLEYFDRALAWLKRQPGVDTTRIGIVGASKGAEAALLIASRHPEVRAVIAGSPSAVIWPGIDFSGGPTQSSWSIGGKAVPFLRYGSSATSMFTAYESGLASLTTHPDAAIPIEAIKAPILLICGQSDRLWPSCAMSHMVARKAGSRATLLAYPDAGHAVFGPPVAPTASGYRSLGALGGSAAGNDAGRAKAWTQVIAFLGQSLAAR